MFHGCFTRGDRSGLLLVRGNLTVRRGLGLLLAARLFGGVGLGCALTLGVLGGGAVLLRVGGLSVRGAQVAGVGGCASVRCASVGYTRLGGRLSSGRVGVHGALLGNLVSRRHLGGGLGFGSGLVSLGFATLGSPSLGVGSYSVGGRGGTGLLGSGIGLGDLSGRDTVRDGCDRRGGPWGRDSPLSLAGTGSVTGSVRGVLTQLRLSILGNDRLDADGRQGEGRLGIQGV